jgi:hypothetical protein
MGALIAYPWAAWMIALVFVYLWTHRRRRLLLITGVAWAAYGGYESLMRARVLCSGECNIRVDLLALYPVLAVLSIAAIVQSRRRAARR